ncbi:DUF5908 family protein [Zoogloea sp.]|uniref:DUF5908 family protein n=1 Tax=Zoogloea sp. TaxID=49181 RepID=UPI0031FD30DD
MPIIVDEVVISVEVGNAASGGTPTPPAPETDRQALVAECVQQVLDILRREQEA